MIQYINGLILSNNAIFTTFPFYILLYFQQFHFHVHLFSLAFASKQQVLTHPLGPTLFYYLHFRDLK